MTLGSHSPGGKLHFPNINCIQDCPQAGYIPLGVSLLLSIFSSVPSIENTELCYRQLTHWMMYSINIYGIFLSSWNRRASVFFHRNGLVYEIMVHTVCLTPFQKAKLVGPTLVGFGTAVQTLVQRWVNPIAAWVFSLRNYSDICPLF